MKLVTIEYVKDVEAHAGHAQVNGEAVEPTIVPKGTVRRVDPMSAKSLVDNRKVAKYVTDAKPKPAPAGEQ